MQSRAVNAEQLQLRVRELETESAESELLQAQLGSKEAALDRLRLQVHELKAELGRLQDAAQFHQPTYSIEDREALEAKVPPLLYSFQCW